MHRAFTTVVRALRGLSDDLPLLCACEDAAGCGACA